MTSPRCAVCRVEFDYIIVGAGSAGCALAGRLAERTNARIALIEAGPIDYNPWLHIPVGYYRTKSSKKLTWGYATAAESELKGRSIGWPRGKVLGGCSAINGLLYIRGHPDDYNDWQAQGARGWGWPDMAPIFRRMEDQQRGADAFHGTGGPLGVVDLRPTHPLMDSYIRAAASTGLQITQDFNGRVQDGIGYFQLTLKEGRRCSAATAYRIRRGHKNLKLLTDTQVAGLEFEDGRAIGVKVLKTGEVIRARREIILSAGAVGSPQILELSGIGTPEILGPLGIKTRVANPAVGEHLQDHFQVKLVFRTKERNTLNEQLNSPMRKLRIALEYALRRKGLMTIGAAQVCGFARLMTDATRPDLQIHAMPGSSDDPARGMDSFPAFTSSVSQLRPDSRGSVHISSAKPRDHPTIHANYLQAETDRDFMLQAVRYGRRIASALPISAQIDTEHRPGQDTNGDEALMDFIRSTGSTNYHPVGTCRIGTAGKGVVDADLRVHGVSRLRIADASVMPRIVSGNTNAPSIAIGEKLADILTR